MMAKMYYSLEEAAERLGIDAEQVKQMASDGKIQQFRDRDKLMFKVDEVDRLAGGEPDLSNDESGIPLADSGDTDELTLQPSDSDTGEIDLKSDTSSTSKGGSTGISVLDEDELSLSDSAAHTQVSGGSDVGGPSGSGLLDLSDQSSDSSLGADQLMDDISAGDSAMGSSGAFGSEELTAAEPAGETGFSMGELDEAAGAATASPAPAAIIASDGEVYDPAGSGWTGGMLLGTMIVLMIGLVVSLNAVLFPDLTNTMVRVMTASDMQTWAWLGGMFVGCLLLAAIGGLIGKSMGARG